jgi:hypothetical protein
MGFWFSEQLLNVLLKEVTLAAIEYHSHWIPFDHPKQSHEFVPMEAVVHATNRDELFEKRLDVKIYPERTLFGQPGVFDPYVLFQHATTVWGYYGWLFVVGSTYTLNSSNRVSVRAILLTPEREDTVFVEDTEISENTATEMGHRLADAIQEYPWWRVYADIIGTIPSLISAISDADSRKAVDAAMALGIFDTPEGNSALTRSLQSNKRAEVRAACAEALGRTLRHRATSTAALVKALEDSDVETRYQSISALIEITKLNCGFGLEVGYPPKAMDTDRFIAKWKAQFLALALNVEIAN